jgi:hypothetical protein
MGAPLYRHKQAAPTLTLPTVGSFSGVNASTNPRYGIPPSHGGVSVRSAPWIDVIIPGIIQRSSGLLDASTSFVRLLPAVMGDPAIPFATPVSRTPLYSSLSAVGALLFPFILPQSLADFGSDRGMNESSRSTFHHRADGTVSVAQMA